MVPLTTEATRSPSRSVISSAPVRLVSFGSMTASHWPFAFRRIQLLSGFGRHVSNCFVPASASGSWFHLPQAWSLTCWKSEGFDTVTSKLNS